MKNFKLISLSIIFLLSINLVSGQNKEKCEVINDDSSGEYVGECKKGLAHGSGIYNFSDGTKVYEGEFKKGKFNGEGTLFSKIDGKIEVSKKGVWKNNSYKGEKKVRPYSVIRKENLERYIIRKISDEGNKVVISRFQNGSRKRKPTTSANSGVRVMALNDVAGYENIEYPFRCEVRYTARNKLNSASFSVKFEFEIREPGSWEVLLYN